MSLVSRPETPVSFPDNPPVSVPPAALDLNDFFNNQDSRIHARTASFCTERSGHYDAFDQVGVSAV